MTHTTFTKTFWDTFDTFNFFLRINVGKGHVKQGNFSATCNTTNIALQVAKKIARLKPHFRDLQIMQQNVALQVAGKVELSSVLRNYARQVAACNMSSTTLQCNYVEMSQW